MGLETGAVGSRGPTFTDLLSEQQRIRLYAVGQRRQVKNKKEIFQAGDEVDGLYLIEEGDVAITLTSPEDKEVAVNQYGPGDVIGEMGVLDDLPRSANAIARSDVSLCFVKTNAFLDYLRQEPDVAIILLRMLTRRLRRTSDVLADAIFLGLEPRLAKALFYLAESHGIETPDGIEISMPMSQSDMGKTIAFSRESTNKMLNKWQKMGLVTHADGKVTIHDPDRLAELIDSSD